MSKIYLFIINYVHALQVTSCLGGHLNWSRILLVVAIFTHSTGELSVTHVTFRCLWFSCHALQSRGGIRLLLTLTSLALFAGTIPGPILFGFSLDKVCILWQETCDGDGSCYIYDNAKMGRNFFILVLAVKLAATVLLLIAWKLYKPPGKFSNIPETPSSVHLTEESNVPSQVETTTTL